MCSNANLEITVLHSRFEGPDDVHTEYSTSILSRESPLVPSVDYGTIRPTVASLTVLYRCVRLLVQSLTSLSSLSLSLSRDLSLSVSLSRFLLLACLSLCLSLSLFLSLLTFCGLRRILVHSYVSCSTSVNLLRIRMVHYLVSWRPTYHYS